MLFDNFWGLRSILLQTFFREMATKDLKKKEVILNV